MPFGHFYMTKTKKFEIGFLQKHYSYPKKPFSTDQHIMFVNAVEDYRLGEHERYGIIANSYAKWTGCGDINTLGAKCLPRVKNSCKPGELSKFRPNLASQETFTCLHKNEAMAD